MKRRIILAAITLLALLALSFPTLATGGKGEVSLLNNYETDVVNFTEVQFGDFVGYKQQRMIGNATVEGDRTVYVFNSSTSELVADEHHWREDLPKKLPENLIAKDEALAIVGGNNSPRAYLYYISPNSSVFQLDPTPENPCWVIWETKEVKLSNNETMPYRFGTIVDAVTGEVIASGRSIISNREVAPVKPNTAVLSKSAETTFVGITPDDKYEWEATIGGPKYLDDLVTPINTTWSYDDMWSSGKNLFTASVNGTEVTVGHDGLKLLWNPEVFVGAEMQNVSAEQLLTTDPINENYHNNTLRWNYGNITRSLRIIEGMLLEYYVIHSLPAGNVTIVPNIVKDEGFDWAKRKGAVDANGTTLNLTIDGDNITLRLEVMQNATFPVTVDPTTSYVYGSDSDGCVEVYSGNDYGVIRNLEEANRDPADWQEYFVIGQAQDWDDSFYISRAFVYFDTSVLPENIEITHAELRLKGHYDHSDQDFYIQIQNGMPDHPEDPMVKADYYRQYYSGNGGDMVTTAFDVGSYNDIVLSEEGESWIDTQGWTKFCLRSSRDINWGGEPDGRETVAVWAYEKGSNYWPQLKITYITQTFDAFSMYGPYDYLNCTGTEGLPAAQQAADFFEDMGYSTLLVRYPTTDFVETQIANNDVALFYEVSHSLGFNCFIHGCYGENWYTPYNETCSSDVNEWIQGYPAMPFTFLHSCSLMTTCYENSLCSAFMRNVPEEAENAAVCGYSRLAFPEADECKVENPLWEEEFFTQLSQGETVGNAFNIACAKYPACCNETSIGPFIHCVGDLGLRLVPKITRMDPNPPPPPTVGYITGEVRDVNGELLYGIEVCVYREDGSCYDCVIANPDYNITVYDLGVYYSVANPEQGCE